MASLDQDSMRDGYDLPGRRLRSRAVHGAANATGAAPGGGAWEAVAAEGGDCRRAADRAGGDDRASGSGIARRPDECPLANSQISTKTLWSAVRRSEERRVGKEGRSPGS